MKGEARSFSGTARRKVRLAYLLYPPRVEPGQRPGRSALVLFLHGLGERGDDLSLVARHGPPKLAEAGRGFPFYLAAPQCPAQSSWIFELDSLRLLLADLVRRYPVDTSRIILTGLSMGGFGTWHLAVENPRAFAGIAPVCGGAVSATALNQRLGVIAHVPVWAFHGARDDVVPLALQQNLVDALRSAGGKMEFTIYPDADHDAWTRTYENPKLYDWMLSLRNESFAL